ncbi:sensor histidine kinase [Streptomyces triticagri]
MAVLLSLLHRSITGRHTDRSVAHIGHLLDRIHSAHNDERLRISRELHDEVAGQLGAALNSLELADLYRADRPADAEEKAGTARDQVQASLTSLREVMTGLRRRIDSEPLRGALLRDVTALGEHPADVRVTVTGDESWLRAGVAEELYLVVREALRNAVRHAHARQVAVAVHVTPQEVRATVEDDGVGFDPRAAAPAGHSGIQSMRERAELLGGSLTVESRPGCGSRIRAFVPLKGEDDGWPG